MHMTSAIAAAILAFCASSVLSAPVPQLGGEGAAANSILSGTDNAVGYGLENGLDNTAKLITSLKGSTGSVGTTGGSSALPPPARRQLAGEGAAANSVLSGTDNAVGYGTENALDNTANLITSVKGGTGSAGTTGGSSAPPPPPPPARRQLAGEGAAANSVLSGTDNAVGYGTENALDNTANLITSVKGGTGSAGTTGGSSAPPPPPPHRRQLDKISNGVAAVSNAAGTGDATKSVTDAGDSIDGSLTGGAANAGAQVASTEESTIEGAGNAIPRRQLDKISNGVAAVSNAAGTGSLTQAVTNAGDSADGSLTSGAANAGAQIASTEESTIEGAGKAIPRRQLDKISNGVAAVSNAAGTGSLTQAVTNAGDSADGSLTSGAANAGAQVASTEESVVEGLGASVPRL